MDNYIVDPRIEKLGIERLYDILDEVVGLGEEYAKICGSCSGLFTICVFIHLVRVDQGYRVGLKGLSIEIGINATVDRDLLLGLMRYVETVKSERGMATFYIPEDYALGAYYMVCRDERLRDSKGFIVDYDEARYLERD